MFRLLPLIFLVGCVTNRGPNPDDTKFNEKDRDWEQIYLREMIIAKENQDLDAWLFFGQELLKLQGKPPIIKIRSRVPSDED